MRYQLQLEDPHRLHFGLDYQHLWDNYTTNFTLNEVTAAIKSLDERKDPWKLAQNL